MSPALRLNTQHDPRPERTARSDLGRSALRDEERSAGRAQLLEAVVDPILEEELRARLLDARGRSVAVTYLTSWSLARAHRHPRFARTLRSCDLVYADGMGVVLAARLTGSARCRKVTAGEFFLELCHDAARRGLRIALVGARPGVVDRLERRLRAEVPALDVALTRHGYLEPQESTRLAADLRRLAPDLVVIGMGQPLQEELALELRDSLESSVLWCVGGLFDQLVGETPEPHPWIRSHGLEWAYRLLTRPRTMWVRYVLGLPYVGWLLARDRFASSVARLAGSAPARSRGVEGDGARRAARLGLAEEVRGGSSQSASDAGALGSGSPGNPRSNGRTGGGDPPHLSG